MATIAASPPSETSLGNILDQVAKEKGIDKKILVETIEAAILKAAQSAFGPTRELEARFNDDTGQRYNADAAKLAWSRTMTAFKAFLS